MRNRLYGIGLTLLLSLAVVLFFFGRSLPELNKTYFSIDGDGFKAYYGALYHVGYDSVNYRNDAMNYPFGEICVFTDSQPPVTNAIRFFSRNMTDIAGCTTGIINGLMLAALILGALFIFLIFNELGVAWWFGALAATGISMLSPQIARLGGHFSLSWQLWLPAMIYFLMRFDKTRNFIYSLLIAITTFFAGKMHLYFLGFYGFLIGGYWFWRFMKYKSTTTYWYRDALQIFIQFLLPVFLVELAILLHDDVIDRTAYPYGFSVYLSHPAGVFLPAGKPWLFVPRIFTIFGHLSWESLAYIGTAALAGIFVTFFLFVRKKIRKEKFGRLSDSDSFNALFWVSVAALIFSFGIPFIFVSDWLLDLFGPVRQLRALGRFAWLFYYFLNILIFAAIYRVSFARKKRAGWKITAVAAFLMLFYEGYWNMETNTSSLQNQLPELADQKNTTEVNSWLNNINPGDYQAIIPLPYFHIGSENIWIDGTGEVKQSAMLASLKTGLPMTGVELSRSSISQTFINYSMLTEPLQRMEFVDFLDSDKPFLVLVMNDYEPSDHEKWLIQEAQQVAATEKFRLLSLPVSGLRLLRESWKQKVAEKFNNEHLYPKNGYLVPDTSLLFHCFSFDGEPAPAVLRGDGAFTFPAREWKVLVEDTLHNIPAGRKMIAGFWVYDYQKDGYLRINLQIVRKNSQSGETTGFDYSDVFRHLKAFSDNWALAEYEFETATDNEVIEISVQNSVLPLANYCIDELMIRDKNLDVWKKDGNSLLMNGREFFLN